MPCPLCLLGFLEPHSKADWDLVAEDEKLQVELRRILEVRELQAQLDELGTDYCG